MRIADVVVCSDPERPLLLESGGNPRWSDVGRKGRQKRRRHAVSQLLFEGQAQLEDDEEDTVTVPVSTPVHYSWEALEQAIAEALHGGVGTGRTSDNDLILAVREDTEVQFAPEARALVDSFRHGALGFVKILEKPDPRVPPPLVWPISLTGRIAVLCSDVFVVHMVDAAAMCGPAQGDCSIVAVDASGPEISGFRAVLGADEYLLSPAFLDDVLLGFQTLESTREQMLELIREADKTQVVSSTSPWPRPTTTVNSLSEAQALVERSAELDPEQWVALPLELWDQLRRPVTPTKDPS